MRGRHIMLEQTRLVSAEEFARIPDDDHRYELVEGRVVRMSPPGARHAVLVTGIASLLKQHADAHGLGVVMSSGGFTIDRGPDTVREPDVAFVSQVRIPGTGVPETFWEGAPDLAVEVVSPSDRRLAVIRKVDQYLARGVRLVWVVDPRLMNVTVYRAGQPAVTLAFDDTLDAGDVMPGFACEVRRLFA